MALWRNEDRVVQAVAVLLLVLIAYVVYHQWDLPRGVPQGAETTFVVTLGAGVDPEKLDVSGDVVLDIKHLDKPSAEISLSAGVINHEARSVDQRGEFILMLPPFVRLQSLSIYSGSLMNSANLRPEVIELSGPPANTGIEHVPGISRSGAIRAMRVTERSDPLTSARGGIVVRIPFDTTDYEFSLEMTADSSHFLHFSRLAEKSFSVRLDVAPGEEILAPDTMSALAARTLQDFRHKPGDGHLRVELNDFGRFDRITPFPSGSESLYEDGSITVEGTATDDSLRYWIDQLDTLAFLVFGAIVGVVVSRIGRGDD